MSQVPCGDSVIRMLSPYKLLAEAGVRLDIRAKANCRSYDKSMTARSCSCQWVNLPGRSPSKQVDCHIVSVNSRLSSQIHSFLDKSSMVLLQCLRDARMGEEAELRSYTESFSNRHPTHPHFVSRSQATVRRQSRLGLDWG
jgi:hypothetical protein